MQAKFSKEIFQDSDTYVTEVETDKTKTTIAKGLFLTRKTSIETLLGQILNNVRQKLFRQNKDRIQFLGKRK